MKIYISKSNQSSIGDIDIVKTILGKRNTLIEFEGGKYDPSIIDDAESIVVIPPQMNTLKKGKICIGRGIYSELTRFLSNNQNDYKNCYLYHNKTYNFIELKDVYIE